MVLITCEAIDWRHVMFFVNISLSLGITLMFFGISRSVCCVCLSLVDYMHTLVIFGIMSNGVDSLIQWWFMCELSTVYYTDNVVVLALLWLLWHTAVVWGHHIRVIVLAVVLSVCNLQASHEWSWPSIVSSAATQLPAWHEAWHHQDSSRFQVSNIDWSLCYLAAYATDRIIESESSEVAMW